MIYFRYTLFIVLYPIGVSVRLYFYLGHEFDQNGDVPFLNVTSPKLGNVVPTMENLENGIVQ